MMAYLLYTAFLIALFYLFYQYLLKNETFFGLHRWWLLFCMGLAFLVPLLQVPAEWSLRSANRVETALTATEAEQIFLPSPTRPDPYLSKVARRDPASQGPEMPAEASVGLWTDWTLADWLQLFYLAGLCIFSLNFLLQLLAVVWQCRMHPTIRDGRFVIVELEADKAPFSFWNFIFINPSKYDWETYQQILDHEKIHVSKRHSLDILLAEALVILQWFNPFAWRYRRAVEHNLEFSTDSSMLRKGTDPQSYQLNLLKVAVPNIPLNLTTNYNQSILKRRIMMMNAKQSSIRSSWKYFFLIPLIGLSVLCFNTPLVSGQQTEPAVDAVIETAYQAPAAVQETLPTAGETLARQVAAVKSELAQWAAEGNWSGAIEDNMVCIHLKHKAASGDHHWSRTECFARSTFSNLPIGKEGVFSLKGEAGTITFNGRFDGEEGKGTYSFQADSGFKKYLEGAGFEGVSDGTLLALCFGQMGKSDVDYLLAQNFPSMDAKDLEAVASIGLNRKQIDYYKKGFSELGFNQLTLDELIGLSIHEVEMDYVKELGDLVYQDMTIEHVIAASIHEVDPDYIRQFQAAGFKNLGFDELIAAAIHEIDPAYIKQFQAAGFKDLDFDDLIAAAIHEVDPAYIKAFQAAGFEDLDFDDLIAASIHDIEPAYIEAFRSAGLEDLDFDDLVAAGIHDIDVALVKSYLTSGLEDLDFEHIVGFGIHGIEPGYIKSMMTLGLEDLDADDLIGAHIHGVDADFIQKARAEGHTDLDLDGYVELKLTGGKHKDKQKDKNKGAY